MRILGNWPDLYRMFRDWGGSPIRAAWSALRIERAARMRARDGY